MQPLATTRHLQQGAGPLARREPTNRESRVSRQRGPSWWWWWSTDGWGAYLGIRRLELDAELLSSGDDDLHLRDAVAVHNVAVREELVLREASADLNDLHLLEDGALARLARTCVDRRDKDDDDDESHERANEWRLSILRSLPLAVPRGSLDSKGKAAAASVPSRSSLTSSCDSWLMSFISVSIWRLRFAFFLSSAVWPWQVLPMVGWLIGRLVGCREVKD